MARMIPNVVDPSVVASERRVFDAIRDAGAGRDWIVLHSLGLSSEWGGEFGEIDFVVIMPGRGIVCVEVKGGGVSVHDGVWTTRDRHGRTERLKRSPYRQAQDGMWKLLSAITKRFGVGSQEARCPIGWLAVFPDVQCPPITTEAARDEIVDRDDFDGDIGPRIHSAPSLARLLGRPDLVPPHQGVCDRIVGFLRPGFERVAAPSSQDWDAEQRIKALTEEQYEALDSLADNAACLLTGPAGTGKTLLGLESARRAAARGEDALVLCFNSHLGRFLSEAVQGFGPGRVVAGNVHAVLRERILASSLASEFARTERELAREQFYGGTFYDLGALAVEEGSERFDHIVIDEVQDIPAARVGDLVKSWERTRGGARLVMLGDFTRQALFTGASDTSTSLLAQAVGPFATFGLRLNCRNTRRIALQTATLSGLGDQRLSEKQPEGDQVSLQFYDSDKAALDHLDRIVRAVRETGQKARDVILLGPRRRENSLLADVSKVGGWPLRDLGGAGPGDLAYSTIHAFKGLERPVVILIDVEGGSPEECDALLYVGMTRARLRLFIVAPAAVRPAMEQRMAAAALAAIGVKHP
ncbi:nuclease-related domain-containing DEAD/DEAH box helicase [Salinarimonas ramus]|uniref:DNA 3'-5' helicase II n=1 Tax=Salinarimonas ramus TaxID=690164 RepID=A0A917V9C7_9HYPH|nr:NERD domain-containing protein [Salinarimonas ramus]GGK52595.1 nuclease [Salinarimonas ramus]